MTARPWQATVLPPHLTCVDIMIPPSEHFPAHAVMQSSALRSRPVWKSTRPDDPPGIQSPPKASGSPSKHGRLRMDVQMAGKTMLVDALTLCDEDFSKGQIKQKLEAYVAGPRTNDVVELVIVIMAKTAASGRVDQLHRLSQVQLLCV